MKNVQQGVSPYGAQGAPSGDWSLAFD